MKHSENKGKWKVLSCFATVETKWLRLIGEKLLDDQANELEYWRVEKPDGLLIIVTQGNELLLPVPSYRPGVGRKTLDFCGGRINPDNSMEQNAKNIVGRELIVKDTDPFQTLDLLSTDGWDVDSSFSNVRIYAYHAEIKTDLEIDDSSVGARYPLTTKGINKLLEDLKCLQCRMVLLEWLHQKDLA